MSRMPLGDNRLAGEIDSSPPRLRPGLKDQFFTESRIRRADAPSPKNLPNVPSCLVHGWGSLRPPEGPEGPDRAEHAQQDTGHDGRGRDRRACRRGAAGHHDQFARLIGRRIREREAEGIRVADDSRCRLAEEVETVFHDSEEPQVVDPECTDGTLERTGTMGSWGKCPSHAEQFWTTTRES